MRIGMTYIFVFVFIYVNANIRFRDEDMMKKHHTHIENNQEKIIVHMIPHSHDDVGWLKTVDQYFYGLRQDLQYGAVEYTIDTYIQALQEDPNRKFIQVETAFFKMWWDLQTEEKKQITKQLIQNGQLEFISGGWCMNDEATPYYEDIIDQMTLGHKFLLDEFNVTPTIGWQIDPFGHQNFQAELSYEMGFDGWFFSRIDYQDKEQRLNKKEMEMVMLPQSDPIFTHVQYYHYEAPPGFNYDIYRRESPPVIDDPKSDKYNIDQRATELVNYFKAEASHYLGNVVMHTFGSDFEWTNSQIFYKNLDKLINYVNSHPDFNMELKYSTPSLYLKEINNQKLTYPTKSDDFFPYADEPHAYWTGYFTSRVAIKGLVKRFGRAAQTYRKLFAYMTIKGNQYVKDHETEIDNALYEMDKTLAINQHHDAVSGTERQHVNDDYMKMLNHAEVQIQKVVKELLGSLTFQSVSQEYDICNWNQTAASCSSYNILSQNKTLVVTLLDGKVNQENEISLIRLKVPNLKYLITDWKGTTVIGDVDCSNSFNDCDLFFNYEIPQDNMLVYFTIKSVTSGESASEIQMIINPFTYTDNTTIDFLNNTIGFKLSYGYYRSYQGDDQPSGAYIFRTADSSDIKTQYGSLIYTALGYGKIVSIFRVARTHTKTVIRKFSTQKNTFQIQTFIDSIPIADNQGKEIVMLIDTNINNTNFYTDTNGLNFQQRIINYRPTWKVNIDEAAGGNYYPVTGAIYIKDNDNMVAAVLNDRSQGGASLKTGQIELMIHRRLIRDDYRGVGERLNEEDEFGQGLQQYVQHTLTFFNMSSQPNHIRKMQYFQDLEPIMFLTESKTLPNIPSGLNWLNALNIKLSVGQLYKLYLQRWNQGEYLLRIQNFQEQGQVKIEIQQNRATITGNQLWSEWKLKRLDWNYTNKQQIIEDDTILEPLQIYTYIINNNHVKQQFEIQY